MMNDAIKKLRTPVYVFDEEAFAKNVEHMNEAFGKYYPNFKIAYSYKTNYTPHICKLANELGCYAEVVSPMEYEHAGKIGSSNIVYNGVIRDDERKFSAALHGAMVNVDNLNELDAFSRLAKPYGNTDIPLGVRLNFDIGNGLVSRFGIDINGADFEQMISVFRESKQLKLVGVHCHISKARELQFWEKRVDKMIDIIKILKSKGVLDLEYIDLGSNMYGPMEESLSKQFGDDIPSYEDYARVIGTKLAKEFKVHPPKLIIEAGTPIVANTMGVLATVIGIKEVGKKTFATMDCSKFNLGAIAGVKNVPIEVLHNSNGSRIENADLVGFTCIEDDVLYRGYNGELCVGDKVLFKNVGAYSNTFAPQFIKPVIGMVTAKGKIIKEGDSYEKVFQSYK